MMISGSTPFSFAMASICCNNGLTVAIFLTIASYRYQYPVRARLPAAGLVETGNRKLALTTSELHRELPALDLRDRHAVHLAALFEDHLAPLDARDPAGKRRLSVQRSGRHHLGQAPGEPPIIRFVPQRSIEAGRRHLERVILLECRLADLVPFDVEQRAQVMTDALAFL